MKIQLDKLKFLRRPRIHNEPVDPVLKDCTVQKLVLKGAWEDRRWNDRRLILYKNRVCYLWNKGEKIIDQISAENISQLAAMYEEMNQLGAPASSPHLRKGRSFVSETSIWDTVLLNRTDHEDELKNCFLLRTQATDGTRREYVFRTESQEDTLSWVEQTRRIVEAATPPPLSLVGRFRRAVRDVFHSKPFQILVTLLITLNFLSFIYVAQARRRPPPPSRCRSYQI